MSAYVLLNLLNKFNKFNNTRARMLDSIYHMIKSHFCCENVIILSLCTQRFPKINKPLVVYRFYCMALFHSQTQRHMISMCLQQSRKQKPADPDPH